MYDGRLTGLDNSNLMKGIACATSPTITQDTHGEFRRAHRQYQPYQNTNPRRNITEPQFKYGRHTTTQIDALKVPDGTSITVRDASDICDRLRAFGNAARTFKLPISWNKVAILVKKHNHEIREIRKTLPLKYRNVKFTETAKVLGVNIAPQYHYKGSKR